MLHICVKLEHAYIRNVNVRWTHTHTDRHDHRLTDHVGLAQARPNQSLSGSDCARTDMGSGTYTRAVYLV